MDNSAGWWSYPLVNAYIWIWFGLVIGVGFFANPWTAVMYATWGMALNVLVRKVSGVVSSQVSQRRADRFEEIDDAGSLNDDDAIIDDFGGLDGDYEVRSTSDPAIPAMADK